MLRFKKHYLLLKLQLLHDRRTTYLTALCNIFGFHVSSAVALPLLLIQVHSGHQILMNI